MPFRQGKLPHGPGQNPVECPGTAPSTHSAFSHSGPLALQMLLGIRAERKFPVMNVHGDKDRIFPVAIARENRAKYQREKHPVTYVEGPGLNHQWAAAAGINDKIWAFFAEHPLKK